MAGKNRTDRANKRVISAFVEDEIFEKFKKIAADKNISTNGLVKESLALLFKQCGEQVPSSLTKRPRPYKSKFEPK